MKYDKKKAIKGNRFFEREKGFSLFRDDMVDDLKKALE